MEELSSIRFEFNDDLDIGEIVSFAYTNGVEDRKVVEEWASVRFGSGQVIVGTPTAIPGETSAKNFATAFGLDFNVSGIFEVHQIENVVTIYSLDYGITFIESDTSAKVDISIIFGTVPFHITDVQFSAGIDCSKILVSVHTSEMADVVISPFEAPVTTNPIQFQWERNVSIDFQVRKGLVTRSQVIGMPSQTFPSSINLDIIDNPAGGIVTINVNLPFLQYTYSLGGVLYSDGNVFSGLPTGEYVAYVKDQYGCITQKAFNIDGFGINSPFFRLPTSNSIRLANRVTWGDCGNYKNDDNTLSCEADVPLAHKEIQQFQACDVITTQFKSNYTGNSVIINGLSGVVVKKTDNMRRKDRRDAILTNLGDGRMGVYFETGNIYDYDTWDVTGDYTLNGALPEWGKAGNFILINNVWYLIQDVLYIDSRGADVLVISSMLAPNFDTPTIVSCFYNRHNYEVYEFVIDFANFVNMDVQVEIRAVDPMYGELRYKSELINVKVRHKNTKEIQYWNDENTDVYFATGIVHKMRMEIERVYGQPAGTIESHDTDTSTVLLSADIRQLDVFEFSPMTKAMMWKIDEALSHKFVTIDGVPYGDKKIEVSESLGDTNLYDVVVTMKKANSLYRSSGLQFDESGMEIPALIEVGTGYVKYQ